MSHSAVARRSIVEALPTQLEQSVRTARNFLRFARYRGVGRHCPVCEKPAKRFAPYGIPPREEACCIHCGSLERHRMTWLYLQRETDLFDGQAKCVLHIAPERQFEKVLRKRIGSGYLTADLLNPRAMVQMDVTDIQYEDDAFDVVYCSHVLEHVDDDNKAMRELRRVLKPSGWAIVLVPLTVETTFEDPSVTDPGERLRLFGQDDHVRRYGPDFAERLRNAGFSVKLVEPEDFLTSDEISAMRIGVDVDDKIFVCTK
ncbi:MAG: methyltransferase domain-containing protein [Steroidobacteraceae bacterium]